MQHIFDIHDYDENFVERFCSNTIPFYDLWSIRPLQNQMKEICTGTSKESDKFRNFLEDHANGDYPPELVIVIGNAEKGNPNNMLNNTKKYFKLRFDKYKGNDLGQPLYMGNPQPYPTGQEQMMPLSFNNYSQRPLSGMGGISYQDIQGIIDKNVTDATRSIRAEYEEVSAKREAEAIKRIAELEMKMELYKLELRAKEIEDKEQKLREEMEDFEERKEEGLGTVKEYTKTIAGGLLDIGKSAFGLDEIESKIKKEKEKKKEKDEEKELKGTPSASFDDDGFTSKKEEKQQNEDAFGELLGIIKGLSVEERMQLMDVLIPEEDIEGIEEDNQESIDEKTSDAIATEDKETEINQKKEENEDIQTDNTDN